MITKQLPDIRFTASAAQAARLMAFWETDRVEVLTPQLKSMGIVTEHDLIHAIDAGKDLSKILVSDLLPHD
jgi:signal-transduction protein with cAMP-binding, CBS, and nucleotidyltransferase domain